MNVEALARVKQPRHKIKIAHKPPPWRRLDDDNIKDVKNQVLKIQIYTKFNWMEL
jgi:hypothetical protein